ncbi:MAG: hypothetical protein JSS49_05905 [Planctomycetes bacterium]|nr:hypothetical protein [Planctomycetota bacterium]
MKFTRLLFLLGTVLVTLPAQAQLKPMEIEQSGIQPSVQMGRPIPSWWDVKVRGTALVEGRFEFKLKNDTRLLTTVLTEDMALTGPQQTIRVLLPPVVDEIPIEQLQLDVRFLGAKFNQDLGTHILRVALPKSRTFVVLSATSKLASKRSPDRKWISDHLEFESLADDLPEAVKTVYAPLDPVNMPQEPMGYCAYDLVVLFGEDFRQLKKQQLEAMAAWIRAGGSLYLEPTGVLESYHVEFLRSLSEFGPRDLVLQVDENGRLIPVGPALLQLTNGLGRIVLRTGDEPLPKPAPIQEWRISTGFLWRLKAQYLQRAASPQAVTSFLIHPQGNMSAIQWRMHLAEKMHSSTTELLDWLMPDGVRMVPLWVLALILTSFVVWIGPVDYFGLGWLKARKFTWVTFPVATLLVTGLTVWITNQYMSSAETRRGMVLRDVGDDGTVVRTNRFELLFIASSRQVTTDVRKGVFASIGSGRSMSQFQEDQIQARYYSRGNYGSMGVDRTVPPTLEGRVPTEFKVTQSVAKWTPQLNRMFWIPGSAEEATIDWTSIVAEASSQDLLNRGSVSGQLHASVVAQFGPRALVACIGFNGKWAMSSSEKWWSTNGLHAGPTRHQVWAVNNNVADDAMDGQPDLFRWIYMHSVAAPAGLFALTSRIGPAGSIELDDLPILDTSDPTQRLLIVVVPHNDDFLVYRKLLRVGK